MSTFVASFSIAEAKSSAKVSEIGIFKSETSDKLYFDCGHIRGRVMGDALPAKPIILQYQGEDGDLFYCMAEDKRVKVGAL